MGEKDKQRMVIRDKDGNITFDSEAVEKSILKVANSPSITFTYGNIIPQSRWAKEVVNLLKEHGEMKNNDMILLLNEKGMPPSYHHISQIFKSESDRKFYEEKLVNKGSYFSLKASS